MKEAILISSALLAILALMIPQVTAFAETSLIQDTLEEDHGNFTSYMGTWEYQDGVYSQTDPLVSGSSWNFGSYFKYAYEDFTLTFRMKLNEVGDNEGYAGVQFRKAKPDDTMAFSGYGMVLKGYGQLALYDWTKTQVIFQIPVEKPFEWHTYKVQVKGRNIQVSIDGVLRQSVNNSAFSSGFISLSTGTAAASFAEFSIEGESMGSADTIGKIGDGNMDKAAADRIFEQRAAIGDEETGEEPAWFTQMIAKLEGRASLNDGTYAADSVGGMLTGSPGSGNEDPDAEIVQPSVVQDNTVSTGKGTAVKWIALAVAGAAVVLMIVALLLFLLKGRDGKGAAAASLVLIIALTGIVTPAAPSAKAEKTDPITFDPTGWDTVFYVSPQGDDGGDGSENAPFFTLRRAQEAVRAAAADQTADIAVVLREGTYTMGSVLTFDENDSGRNGYNVVWMSYPGELVRISGGKAVTGWTKEDGSVWSAKIALKEIDSLFVNGVRAEVANSGVQPLELVLFDQNSRTILVKSEDLKDVTGGDILLYQDWQTHIMPIDAIRQVPDNPTASEISFPADASELFYRTAVPDLLNQCTKYILQNDPALLDQPGEYYYDADAQTLYYIPRSGEDMETAEVYAPSLDGLVRIKGSSKTKTVEHLVFRGLVFEYAGFVNYGPSGAYQEYQSTHYYCRDNGTDYPDMDVPTAAIHIQNAHDIRLERSVIRYTGGSGVNFYHAVHDSAMDGCLVTDIAGNGVTLGVYANAKVSGSLYNPEDPEVSAVHNVAVTNNTITWVGRRFRGGDGIANILGYEIVMRNNEIAYVSAVGIANGWGWSTRDYVVKENTVAFNDIHHVALTMVDVAGIYNLNSQKGTQIRANYVHDLQRSGTGRSGAPVYALYLDEGSNWLVVTDNVAVNNFNDGILFHSTGGNIYSLGNDLYNEATVNGAGVGRAYASLTLRRRAVSGMSMVKHVSLGQPVNSLNGQVGVKITPNTAVSVKAIGRFFYAGNTDLHELTIYNAADNSVVATAMVDMAAGTADENGFKYVALDTPITLQAGASYYVVSAETAGGDVWMDRICKTVGDPTFTLDGGVTYAGEKWNAPQKPGPDYMNGPVNLLFLPLN